MGRRTGTKASSYWPSTPSSPWRCTSSRRVLRPSLPKSRMSGRLPTYDGAVKAGRPYFFEIFTLANFLLLLFVVRHLTTMPLTTLGVLAPSIAGVFLLQALVGMAIRLAFSARKGTACDLLAVYRTKGWLLDTLRLGVFAGLWMHTYGWIKLMIPLLHPRLFDQQLWNLDRT